VRCVAAARKTLGEGVVLGEVIGVKAGLLVALDER